MPLLYAATAAAAAAAAMDAVAALRVPLTCGAVSHLLAAAAGTACTAGTACSASTAAVQPAHGRAQVGIGALSAAADAVTAAAAAEDAT